MENFEKHVNDKAYKNDVIEKLKIIKKKKIKRVTEIIKAKKKSYINFVIDVVCDILFILIAKNVFNRFKNVRLNE